MAFDVITPEKFGQASISTSPTLTTIYTVPASTRAIVKTIDIANTSSSALTITIYFVPSGGSAGASNTIIPSVTLPPTDIMQWSGAQVLNEGDVIQATASGSGVTVTISGGSAV